LATERVTHEAGNEMFHIIGALTPIAEPAELIVSLEDATDASAIPEVDYTTYIGILPIRDAITVTWKYTQRLFRQAFR